MSIRVSDSYLSHILVADLNRSLGTMLKYQRMAGTMRRINSFADDPRSVGAVNRYNSLISDNKQYLRNTQRSRVIVDATDTALQTISDILISTRELALRESSALGTPDSNAQAMTVVDNMVNQLLDVLNGSIEGNYIFSGHQTNRAPFILNGNTVIYQGDDNEILTQTGPHSTTPINIPGSTFMGSQSSVLGGTVDMAPVLELTTLLDDVGLGQGWQPGSIAITDGGGSVYNVDLSSCTDINDLAVTIAADTAGAINLAISADQTALEITGAGPLSISEVDSGTTANSLGINAQSLAGVLIGRDIRPPIAATTDLADISSISGSLPLGAIDIDYNGVVYNVNFAGATTINDLQTIVLATVPGMELQISPSNISLVAGAAEAFTVTNADATNSATLLGLEGVGSPVRLFGVMEDLRLALQAADSAEIHSAMTELEALEETIKAEIIRVGGRQNKMDWIETILMQTDERLRSDLSLEVDADVAQVASDLSRAESVYQAGLLVTSQLFDQNLIMYLR